MIARRNLSTAGADAAGESVRALAEQKRRDLAGEVNETAAAKTNASAQPITSARISASVLFVTRRSVNLDCIDGGWQIGNR